MNYSLHCHELHAGEALPQEPVIFMKPDSALLKDSKPFLFPIFVNRWTTRRKWWCAFAVWEKNISERFAHRYYDAVTVGIDLPPVTYSVSSVLKESLGNCARVLTVRLPLATGCQWKS